jgi:germination protein M
MRIVTNTMLALICLASLIACSRKDAPSPGKPARVSATKAYQSYFGPAPTTDKGTCYAFVIYFPAAGAPGKVVPFPFFSFDEPSLKKVALQRLMGGMDEKSYAGQFLQLFPKGTRLLSLSEQNGTLTADFSRELAPVAADEASAAAIFNMVSLTVMQFGGVDRVRIQSEGRDLFALDRSVPAEGSVVLQPSAPRLLNVTAMKDKAEAPVDEVDALFDRPVDIKEFQFQAVDGTKMAGDIFYSMFDMAAVLKPKDAVKLQAGTGVKVHWKVVDKMGRSAAGDDVFPLDVKVHQD